MMVLNLNNGCKVNFVKVALGDYHNIDYWYL